MEDSKKPWFEETWNAHLDCNHAFHDAITYNIIRSNVGWKCHSKSWCFTIDPLPFLTGKETRKQIELISSDLWAYPLSKLIQARTLTVLFTSSFLLSSTALVFLLYLVKTACVTELGKLVPFILLFISFSGVTLIDTMGARGFFSSCLMLTTSQKQITITSGLLMKFK